jgi:hypothetical protein
MSGGQKRQGRARKRLRATAHKKTLINREKLHQSLEESDAELSSVTGTTLLLSKKNLPNSTARPGTGFPV